jgi:PAS domain S-box-containing protein
VSTRWPAELSQAVIEQGADAIIVADREGRIRVWNAGAKAVFGYAEREALGEPLDLIIPERFRSAHWTAFDRAIASGQTKHDGEAMTTRSVTKDGTDLYVDIGFALVKDDAGEVLAVVAVARDVTARYTSERELRRRVTELEAQLKAVSFEGPPQLSRHPRTTTQTSAPMGTMTRRADTFLDYLGAVDAPELWRARLEVTIAGLAPASAVAG